MGIIYQLENKINGMSYVGLTRYSVEKRLKEHLNDHRNYYIDNALRKYGLANFNVIVLEEVEDSKLSEREKYWIEHIDCVFPKGYNNTCGGEESFKPSERTKHKISETLKGRFAGEKNPMYGTVSPMRGRVGAMKGKRHSKKTIQKMIESRTGENSKIARPIICLETGVYYVSSRQASEELKIARSSLSCALNGKQKTAGGYHWIFSDDFIP